MTTRTWVILGATSIIAEKFAHLAAKAGNNLRLVGRDQEQLQIIAADITLRYKISCSVMAMEMSAEIEQLPTILTPEKEELDLFIAHSDFTANNHLTPETINTLIKVNILSTSILINAYLNIKQQHHHLIYLSSVAAYRGRAKNSLYGASKAAIEIYLQGLQQAASNTQHITIARLGFIDTKQTYGIPGVFHAADPNACAKACWKAISKKQRLFFYPHYWRLIMGIITSLPFLIYKKMKV